MRRQQAGKLPTACCCRFPIWWFVKQSGPDKVGTRSTTGSVTHDRIRSKPSFRFGTSIAPRMYAPIAAFGPA